MLHYTEKCFWPPPLHYHHHTLWSWGLFLGVLAKDVITRRPLQSDIFERMPCFPDPNTIQHLWDYLQPRSHPRRRAGAFISRHQCWTVLLLPRLKRIKPDGLWNLRSRLKPGEHKMFKALSGPLRHPPVKMQSFLCNVTQCMFTSIHIIKKQLGEFDSIRSCKISD